MQAPPKAGALSLERVMPHIALGGGRYKLRTLDKACGLP